MDKRYQVFISSTFKDLQDERREVMHALLEMDCFPAGMELFPASDDDQWTLIKRVIDECDYYLLIVGNRYGSLDDTGVSYTEKEYDYAVQMKKPVMAFVHSDPGTVPVEKTDMSEAAQARLTKFRAKVQKKMCKFWKTPQDLGGLVARSLSTLKKTHPAEGWVKASNLASSAQIEKVERLRERIHELEQELEHVRTRPPSGATDLASGSQEFTLSWIYYAPLGSSYAGRTAASWNYLFGALAPYMFDPAPEDALRQHLSTAVLHKARYSMPVERADVIWDASRFVVSIEDWHTVQIQFKALGLITRSAPPNSADAARALWVLTPFGESHATMLRAIPKSGGSPMWTQTTPPAGETSAVDEPDDLPE